ncbi:MAG: cyclic nucleotide-binding domain-containing protein [Pseudomonadota bacterium]|nr:cyclic nucleotide-binding domain-containing protein [Pseudomonadota bacterium]
MSMTSAVFKEQFPVIASHCGPAGLEDLLTSIETRNVHAGETITTDGEHCDSLFLVTEGKLVSQISSEKEAIRLGMHKKGDCFGEVNILDPGPSTSTVIAIEDSTLLVLTHDAFLKLDKPHPQMTGNILRMLSETMVERCRLADKLLFSKYSYIEGAKENNDRKHPGLIEWGRNLLQKMHGHKETQQ